MERLSYILDTNVVADYINDRTPIRKRLYEARRAEHTLYLSQPVHFEVIRGLWRTNSTRKLTVFEDDFAPLLVWLPLTDADWRQAAQLWVQATRTGKHLSDIDLLVAALATRINAVVVTSDDDYHALPVKHENWRDLKTS